MNKQDIEFTPVRRRIGDLIEYKDNPRKLTPKRKAFLLDSIKEYGLAAPPIINTDNVVLAGNQRLKVLSELFLPEKEIWTMVPNVKLTKKQAADYNLRDNISIGDWDDEIIITTFEADYLLSIGFEKPDLGDFGFKVNGFDRPVFEVANHKTSIENVNVSKLKPHPLRYREHPEDQIVHLVGSIQRSGFYRNVITAQDYTILDGHAITQAAERVGLKKVPVMKLDIKPTSNEALAILTGQNELGKFSEVDDRKLVDILKKLKDNSPDGLNGTGYDEMMLANLAMVTRNADEIEDINAAAEWVGMPEFEPSDDTLKIIVHFTNETDRESFQSEHKLKILKKESKSWSTRWPYTGRQDLTSLKFEG